MVRRMCRSVAAASVDSPCLSARILYGHRQMPRSVVAASVDSLRRPARILYNPRQVFWIADVSADILHLAVPPLYTHLPAAPPANVAAVEYRLHVRMSHCFCAG